jgi:NADH-quinone oxidoreductase subunit A
MRAAHHFEAAFALAEPASGRFIRRMDSQLEQYIPILILGLVAVGFAVSNLILSKVAGMFAAKRGVVTPTKNIPYECGMLPMGEGSTRLSVKFYLVALLFVLFDIEVVFMYPWAAVYKEMLATHGFYILGAMLSFLGILFIGYIYALKKGALDWKKVG